MKALVYMGPEKIEVQDVAIPKRKDGFAQIKVTYCGVCGSDIGIYSGKHPRAKAPLILGHEFIGVIDEIENSKKEFKKGDRVAAYPLLSCGECFPCKTGSPHVCEKLGLIGIDVDGGMAEYVNASEDVLFKIDDSVSDKAAAVIEPLAVIIRAVHQAHFKALDSAVVIGAGPIGILTGIVLKYIGASKIIISDIDEARLAMCKEVGFETVNIKNKNLVEYVQKSTNGICADIVFEASGAAPSALEMTKLARVGGTICMTGIHKEPHAVNLQDVNFKEQHMIGTRVYTLREFGQAVEYAKEISHDMEKIVTHIIGWDKADQVFDYIKDPNKNTVKVLIDCRT